MTVYLNNLTASCLYRSRVQRVADYLKIQSSIMSDVPDAKKKLIEIKTHVDGVYLCGAQVEIQ